MRYTHIVTHARFHLDEVMAILLLQLFGEKKYPGINQAGLVLITRPDAINAEEALKTGSVCVGCGGGIYDEHGHEDNSCAAALVATDLNISRDYVVAKMIDYAVHADRTADVRPQELPSLIKQWHRVHPDDSLLVLKRALEVLRDWARDGMQFQLVYKGLRFEKQQFQTVLGERTVAIAIIRSDNEFADSPHAATVARIKKADIVVKQIKRGNIAVLTDKRAGLTIEGAVGRIRKLEMTKRGSQAQLDMETLGLAGTIREVPQWYYLKAGELLLNGSDQASPDVEPTALTIEEVIEALKAGTGPALNQAGS